MPGVDTSLDLSEFFGNDDSHGRRLAEFLRKRRGVQRQNFIFKDFEVERLSFEVQLEKVPEQNENDHANDGTAEINKRMNIQKCIIDQAACLEANANSIEIPESVPFTPKVPVRNLHKSVCLYPPRSPCFSSVSKSGAGFSPRDRFRCHRLKRQTKICGRRRILLHELENMIDEEKFEPPVCSTPRSQPQSNSTGKSPIINVSCCRPKDAFLIALQYRNDELKEYMKSILEKQTQTQNLQTNKSVTNETKTNTNLIHQTPKLSLKRVFNFENGKIPEQLILTPNKSPIEQSSRHSNLFELQKQFLQRKLIKPRLQNLRAPNLGSYLRVPKSSSHLDRSILQKDFKTCSLGFLEQYPTSSNLAAVNLEVPNTPQQRTVPSIFPSQDEVSKARVGNQNSITITSTNREAVVVSPLNQTFNSACPKEAGKTIQAKHNSPIFSAQLPQLPRESNVQINQLTEDEDEIPEATASSILDENTEAPLNLAAIDINSQRKSLRKRSSLGRSGSIINEKHILLNREPRIPLNGEHFAQELARISNYKILDLRKRNSVGNDIKKQLQLEDLIAKEMLKSNVEDKSEKQAEQIRRAFVDDVYESLAEPCDYFTQQGIRNISDVPSLEDEMSSNRVSLNNKKPHRHLNKAKNKNQPEILEQYLKGDFRAEEPYSLNKRNSNCKTRKPSILFVLSPSKSDDNSIVIQRIISPPPPFNVTIRKFTTQEHQQSTTNEVDKFSNVIVSDLHDNVILLSPPPGFTNNSEVISNDVSDRSTTSNTFQTEQLTVAPTNEIFKNPLQPAPKKGQPRKDHKISANDLLPTTKSRQSSNDSDVSTEGTATLRRSKRVHVSLKPTPIIQISQQLFKRDLKLMEKKKKENREISKGKKKNSEGGSSAETISRQNLSNSKRTGGKQKSNASGLEPFIVSLQQAAKTLNKNKVTKIRESKVLRKQSKNRNKTILSNDFEYRRLILTTAPPIDHLNNVFDDLRNQTPAQTTAVTPLEIKPFEGRSTRSKSSVQPIACDSASAISPVISNNSMSKLISWLNNVAELNSYGVDNEEIIKEMRISPACHISFTELQGLEYVFYYTEEKSSFGYLRFKPRQTKTKRKAKRFYLHFITLVGNFRITANDKERRLAVGDIAAVEKSVYYDIENVNNDIGILMVIKI